MKDEGRIKDEQMKEALKNEETMKSKEIINGEGRKHRRKEDG